MVVDCDGIIDVIHWELYDPFKDDTLIDDIGLLPMPMRAYGNVSSQQPPPLPPQQLHQGRGNGRGAVDATQSIWHGGGA